MDEIASVFDFLGFLSSLGNLYSQTNKKQTKKQTQTLYNSNM